MMDLSRSDAHREATWASSGCNLCSRPNGSKVVKKNERYVIKFLIRQSCRHSWSFIFIELKSFFTLFPALHNNIHWKRNWRIGINLIRSTLVIQSVFGIVGHCSDLFVSSRSSLWRSDQDSSVLGSVVMTQATTKTRKKNSRVIV